MSELLRVTGIGLAGGLLALTLRRERPEFAAGLALITSAVILWSVTDSAGSVISSLKELITKSGVDENYFIICIKTTGIAYISQFASELLRDCGEGAIASKIESAGKITILMLTLPVMRALIEMCVKAVNSI